MGSRNRNANRGTAVLDTEEETSESVETTDMGGSLATEISEWTETLDDGVTDVENVETIADASEDDSPVHGPAVPVAPKLTKAERIALATDALNLAFSERDITSAVAAIRVIGRDDGLTLVSALAGNAMSALLTDIDMTNDAAMLTYRESAIEINTYKLAVESAVVESFATNPSNTVATDPTVTLVRDYVRALVQHEIAGRERADALTAAENVPDLAVRANALLAEHGFDTDGREPTIVVLTPATEALASFLSATARRGRKPAVTTDSTPRPAGAVVRPPAPNTPQNGAGGWCRPGLAVTHITEAIAQHGGRATLREIQTALTSAYPAGCKSATALANSFHRGVEGYTMSANPDPSAKGPDAWVAVSN